MSSWKEPGCYLKSFKSRPWLSLAIMSYALDIVLTHVPPASSNNMDSRAIMRRTTFAASGFVMWGSIGVWKGSLLEHNLFVTGAALNLEIVLAISFIASGTPHDLTSRNRLTLISAARCFLLALSIFQNTNWDFVTTKFNNTFRVKPVNFGSSEDKKRGRIEADSWRAYFKELSIFLPYLNPGKNRKMQLCMVTLALSSLAQRVLVVAIPAQIGIITDSITTDSITQKTVPFKPVLIWLGLNLIKGQCGLRTIQQMSQDYIRSFINRQLSLGAFNHVMGLSMSFHDSKDSADVIGATFRGDTIADILNLVLLELIPSIVDVVLGCAYMYSIFDSKIMVVFLCNAGLYILFDIWTSRMRTENRRYRDKIGRKHWSITSQAISSWSTVAYFGRFRHESERVADIARQREEAEIIAKRLFYFQYTILDSLMTATHFSVIHLVLSRIVRGDSSVGSLVSLMSHWQYLMSPLRNVTVYYEMMQYYVVQVERLTTLFRTRPDIVDAPDAYDLPPGNGEVRFRDVAFAYDQRKPTLSNVDFLAPAGKTIGLVGETGAGKSTIFRLISRFYDITSDDRMDETNTPSSSISIDGHDVRSITQQSLRSAIGIVPQNPSLFNESIRENVRYARLEATDEDVEAACRSAILHDRIASFPDGYDSHVGERGVKLSGGEVQRVAIARVFLQLQAKDSEHDEDEKSISKTEQGCGKGATTTARKPAPRVILLDEATSSVDTETESRIHASLIEKLLSTRCTVFIIAHRLSTVVVADEIFVLGQPTASTDEKGDASAGPPTVAVAGEKQNGPTDRPAVAEGKQNGSADHPTLSEGKHNNGTAGAVAAANGEPKDQSGAKQQQDGKRPADADNKTRGKSQEPGATIVERGTHAELLSLRDGKYKRLWEKQMACMPTVPERQG